MTRKYKGFVLYAVYRGKDGEWRLVFPVRAGQVLIPSGITWVGEVCGKGRDFSTKDLIIGSSLHIPMLRLKLWYFSMHIDSIILCFLQ